MELFEAQQQFADFVKSLSDTVNAYYWWLSGEAPNSLCKFLGVQENDIKILLRFFKVYHLESNDNFKKKNFDSLMLMCHPHVSWVEYRLNGKPERFIKIGLGGVGL